MITLLYSATDWFSAEIVYKALVRSFAKNQVKRCLTSSLHFENLKTGVFVFINPTEIDISKLPARSKIIVFGKMDTRIADKLQINLMTTDHTWTDQAVIHFDSTEGFDFPIKQRPFVRYDFPNEWNNLGYGAIQKNQCAWSIEHVAQSDYTIATITDQTITSAYITLTDFQDRSCVWINRTVGLVDSANWRFIEHFVSAYRFTELYSQAYLLDIPADCEMAATMRLDCDEDILSAMPLFKAYKTENIPFSLAIKTSLPITEAEIDFFHQIQKANGAILSHSVNHKVSWGVDYCDAFDEAYLSRMTLEQYAPTPFAVSPFHSNKIYAVKAMEDAGYAGFIAGIIANDPEYLMARGGAVPFAEKIVSHSQQCMMHGDCLLDEADSLRIYKEAFDLALSSNTFFGFLDHPFSPRYQYGWKTETQRIAAHLELIHYMQSQAEVLFLNENDCLHFMIDKSNATIQLNERNQPKLIVENKQSTHPIGMSLNHKVMGS